MENDAAGRPLDPEQLAGQEIRRLREARGWSQQETARRMEPFGYRWHQTMIAKIEAGTRPLRVNELTDFAALLGVSVADLTVPKVSLEEAEAQIAELEPQLEEAKRKAAATETEMTSRKEAHEEAVYELNRLTARLSYLQRRRDALTPRKGGPK